ncbi:vWA domain-containing protein [Bosea lathyri]|uniref:Ca-activated chloride channel family protein n=1 Tax=Bosea lathyri TaxID=1036778 RepID=A0A1H5UXY5_9HYPH|nr:VWA domain-containing protein [Bosea lathyri]SEF79830.1 Ca-activated chloride channel family protein [Bosea lathyri]
MYQLEYPWLLLVLPLPLLVWWLTPPFREETASVRLAFFSEVSQAAGVKPTAGAVIPKTNWVQKLLAPLCWGLVVLALARPQFVEPPIEKIQPARDLLLALDLSQSMDTRDFRSPSGAMIPRVEAVRNVVADFVKRRSGDRIGLIAFGDAPYPLAPFTLDHDTVLAMIAAMVPGMAGPRTALGDAVGLGIKMFSDSKAQEKVLVVLTDGNDTASKMPPARAADIAKQSGVLVHTVGIGDPKASGEDRLDATVLEAIAKATGGRYFFGQDEAALREIYATLDAITPANQKTLSWRPKHELFHYPLGAAIALLLAYQLIMASLSLLQKLRRARRHERSVA